MHTYPFKCHIHGYASLKDFSFGLLIFPDLLSYENNKEFIFKQLQPVFFFFFTIFFTYQKSFDVFLKFLP